MQPRRALLLTLLTCLAAGCRKSPPGREPTPAADAQARHGNGALTVNDVVEAFELTEKEPDLPSLPGRWMEGTREDRRIAFDPSHQDRWFLFVGELQESPSLSLGRVSAARPLPSDRSRRLDPWVGEDGADLARAWFLNTTAGEELPQLRIPEIRAALGALSGAVEDVLLFPRGVELVVVARGLTLATLTSDVDQSLRLAGALEDLR
jgi:hypothetical protein